MENKLKNNWRFDNLYPMIVTVFGVAFTILTFYFGLSVKIDLLTQRVDTLIENQKILISKYEGVQARLGTLELVNQQIKTILKIN